jgi:DNA-binding LytR/AlgR family response regulator
MIKVAICDDENEVINQIEKILLKESEINHILIDIEVFYSGEILENAILNRAQYDLLFLDIHMNGKNGITVARDIRKVDENLLIVYVSGYERYLMELFRLDVFDFIKKPIHYDSFVKTFLAAYHRICSKKIYFSFQYKNELHKVLCSEIIYFESNGRQIQIYMKNGETEVFNCKLNEVEEQLITGKIPFLRIHQSFLVNYHRIKKCTKTKVTMENRQQLPISVERQKNFIQHYIRLLRGEIIG